MIYAADNAAGSVVYDNDGSIVKNVLSVDTSNATVVVSKQPIQIGEDGNIAVEVIQYTTILCFQRIEERIYRFICSI